MSNMDSIDIQVSASAKNANAELDNLIVKLAAVQKSLSSIGGKSTNFGTRIKSQSNTATDGLNKVSTSMNKATKSTTSLASAFGSLYANFFWVIRGAKGLKSALDSTSDYIEDFNYYTVAFDKIASEWDGLYESYGSENAQKYTNAFVTQMNEELSKMSGIKLNLSADMESGTLSSSVSKNLALNLQAVTQYAAQIASITNSVGQNGAVSSTASSVFTKLAGDMSSLFNVDYSSVAKNLQSGLIGQSRALYKYGIDITNATLQTYAYELGLEKAVSEMTQAEKMQLRMLAILDQSKVAWGDLADTINTPANMLRQWTNNLKEASMMLGQLFMPLLERVLPMMNGATIALKNFLSNIAGFMGITIDLSSMGSGTSDVLEELEDVTGGYEDATSAAKKYKNQLRGFDELNVINTQQSSETASSGSIIDLTSEILASASKYEDIWNEAFANMENKAIKFAEKFAVAFSPVEKLFNDIKIGDWFAVGQDVSTITTGIFDFLANAIANVDWQQLGQNIGLFLVGIDWTDVFSSLSELIGNTIEGLVEAYEWTFNMAPLETAIISAIGLLKFTPVGSIISKKIAQGIATSMGVEIAAEAGIWTALKTALSTGMAGIAGLKITDIGLVFGAGTGAEIFAFIIKGISGIVGVIGGAITAVSSFLDMLENGFSWFNEMLMVVGIGLTAVGPIILGAPALITAGIAAIVAAVGTLVVVIKDNWDSIVEWTSDLFDKVSGFFSDLWSNVEEIWSTVATWFNDNIIQPVISFFVGFATRVGQVFEGLWIIVQAIWKTVSGWFNTNVVQPIIGFFSPIVTKISNFFVELWNKIKSVWSSVSNWFSVNIATPVANVFKIACDKIGGFFSSLWAGIKIGVVNSMNAVIGGIESAINFIVGGINKIIKGFNKIVSWAAEVAEVDWGGVDLVPKVYLSRIQAYEVGGFPEDGLFFANHNELVGKFTNGRTAVANNEQIVAGIREGVREAVAEVLAPYLADIAQNTRETADKDFTVASRDVFNAVRTESNNYTRRTGKPAFSY